MQIEALTNDFARQAAELHIKNIPTGFISSLGINFVTALYGCIAEDNNSFSFVAVDDGKVIGFVAFSTNLSKLYKYVGLKRGFKFGFILARKMVSFRVIKKVFDNIFYPSKMAKMNLPDAELLSIVVASQGRGKGVANQLVDAGFAECRKRSIERVKVLVAAGNEPANKLYQKCGFELATQIESHGVKSNIYVRDLTRG